MIFDTLVPITRGQMTDRIISIAKELAEDHCIKNGKPDFQESAELGYLRGFVSVLVDHCSTAELNWVQKHFESIYDNLKTWPGQ